MKATMYAEDFNALIDATKGFVSKSENKPMLQTIQLVFDKDSNSVTAYAVNGYICSKEASSGFDIEESFTANIFPPKLKAPKNSLVLIKKEGDNAFVSYPEYGITFQSRVTGEFFDCEKAMQDAKKEPCAGRVGLNADYIIEAAKAAKALNRRNGCDSPVIFEFREPSKPVFLTSGSGGERMILPVRIKD